MFSEESKLLIEHWEAVEDIRDAEKRLEAELSKFLHSHEDVFKVQGWWTPEWTFHREDSQQFYISHENWKVDGRPTIWIGVEGFRAPHVFGTDSPPSMYVWVPGDFSKRLCGGLIELMTSGTVPPLGDLDQRSNNYVARKALPKCLPDEAGMLAEMTTNGLLEFFGHYAAYEPQFTEVVRRAMTEDES